MSKRKPQIIIIGAGAAGLYAARLLHNKGVSFTIIEASNRHGGRIRALIDPNFTGFPIELGAENIHGHKNQKGKRKSFLYKDIMKYNPNLLTPIFTGGRTQDELFQIDTTTVWDSKYEDKEIDKVWKFCKKKQTLQGKRYLYRRLPYTKRST